jgi:hypothetical protein
MYDSKSMSWQHLASKAELLSDSFRQFPRTACPATAHHKRVRTRTTDLLQSRTVAVCEVEIADAFDVLNVDDVTQDAGANDLLDLLLIGRVPEHMAHLRSRATTE